MVENKINSSIFIINKVKNFLPKIYLKTLYYSLINPYIEYGLLLSGATQTTLKNIQTKQKKAITIINHADRNTHTNPLFRNLNIFKLTELYEHQVSKFMYRHNNSTLPKPLKEMFTTSRTIHQYNTRNKDHPLIPLSRYELCEGACHSGSQNLA